VVELIRSPWRREFNALLAEAHEALILASPFIKEPEAESIVEVLANSNRLDRIQLTVLTDFRADSVLSSSLDITALLLFADRVSRSRIISVPRLHAKVYVADTRRAVVTSANLTAAGLDENVEYGVAFSSPGAVEDIATDILNYSRLGSPVASEVLKDLVALGRDLAEEYAEVQRSVASELRHRFNRKLREASTRFIATQVGGRTPNAVFSEAILYVLSGGPLTTTEMHPRIQRLLPDLCDDAVELVINGQAYGKKWKHHVRNAQQNLKRQGLIHFNGRHWLRAAS